MQCIQVHNISSRVCWEFCPAEQSRRYFASPAQELAVVLLAQVHQAHSHWIQLKTRSHLNSLIFICFILHPSSLMNRSLSQFKPNILLPAQLSPPCSQASFTEVQDFSCSAHWPKQIWKCLWKGTFL